MLQAGYHALIPENTGKNGLRAIGVAYLCGLAIKSFVRHQLVKVYGKQADLEELAVQPVDVCLKTRKVYRTAMRSTEGSSDNRGRKEIRGNRLYVNKPE